MNRTTLMNEFKNKFGGQYVKENGRWYWVKDNQKSMISNGWLLGMLRGSHTPKQEIPPHEVSQHSQKTMVENAGDKAPVEEQEPANETPELSEEELKKQLKLQKRREKRAKRKLEQQEKLNDDE